MVAQIIVYLAKLIVRPVQMQQTIVLLVQLVSLLTFLYKVLVHAVQDIIRHLQVFVLKILLTVKSTQM
jgi:hypothetical protein